MTEAGMRAGLHAYRFRRASRRTGRGRPRDFEHRRSLRQSRLLWGSRGQLSNVNAVAHLYRTKIGDGIGHAGQKGSLRWRWRWDV